MAQSYTSPPSMSQRLRSLLSWRTPEEIEPSGIPKDHRISADQAESSTHNADTDLCPRCLSIKPKIQELLSLDHEIIWVVKNEVLELQSADDLFKSPSCSLCQALKFICPNSWFTDEKCSPCLVEESIIEHEEYTRHSCLTLRYSEFPFQCVIHIFDAMKLDIIGTVGCIAEKPALEQHPGIVFADSLPDFVDFKLLQQWLESSESEGNFIEGIDTVRNLMVIDCESGKIIKAPPAKYAALSYVWGQEKPKEGELEEIEGSVYLKRPLEKTIEDALTVTRQLNLRYLWVDRYCIPQDDFKYQISKMHEIYGGAHVTIIAAAGNGPQHGLPGVNQTRRTRPPPVTIGSHTLFATFPNPKLLVEESKWYSRGWTFQEGLLSRRRLVFTDHQVFFHCDSFIFFEAFSNCLPHGITLRHEDVPPLGTLFSFATESDSRKVAPWDRIAQYCTLDLTNPEDTVNAILGVLNYYQEGTHRPSTKADARLHEETVTIRHITGLPISRTKDWPSDSYEPWEGTIICALFWQSKTPGDRQKPERMPFPSWSWAGWKFNRRFSDSSVWLSWEIRKRNPESLRGSFESVRNQNRYLPSILIETEESKRLLRATEYETMFDKMHDFSKIRYLHVTALTVDARIVTYDDDRLWRGDRLKQDNTGKKLVLECSGAEKPAFLNLTSNSIYQQPMPLSGHPCLAIILDFDPDTESTTFESFMEACLLVVGITEDCYERIGVAHIKREALRETHIKKQEDIKLG